MTLSSDSSTSQVLSLQACTITPGLCDAVDPSQGLACWLSKCSTIQPEPQPHSPPFFQNKNRPASSGLWGEGWTESLKLGQSQKLPILAPAFSAPTHPPSSSLLASFQAAPPCPSPGLPEFWERKSGWGLRQMQALSINLSASWRREAPPGEEKAPVGPSACALEVSVCCHRLSPELWFVGLGAWSPF